MNTNPTVSPLGKQLLGKAGLLNNAEAAEYLGLAEARGVDEAEPEAAELEARLDPVAGGAGLGAHDGALLAEEEVEEARLARVGRSREGHAEALRDEARCPEGRGKGFEVGAQGGEGRQGNLATGFLLAVVESELDLGDHGEEARAGG